MSGKAIEHLVEFPLSWGELSTLPDEQLALLSLASFAASELNALQRIYIQSAHDLEGDPPIDAIIATQRYVLLRTWSAKLFEFAALFQDLDRRKKCKDEIAASLVSEAVKNFEELKSSDGYDIARNVRHEASNHYSFEAALKNLKHVPDHALCNMHLHEIDGNSHFPLGEEVMFVGRMNRHGKQFKSKEEKQALLSVWQKWNLSANEWMRATHLDIHRAVVKSKFPKKLARKRSYWIERSLVSTMTPPSTPIFLRKDDNV